MKRLFNEDSGKTSAFVSSDASRILLDIDPIACSTWAFDDEPVTIGFGTESSTTVTPSEGECQRIGIKTQRTLDIHVSLDEAERLHRLLGKALRAARKMQAEDNVKFSIDANGQWTQED